MKFSHSKDELDDILDLFDIQAYLDDAGIPYDQAGAKNVSEGYIGIACMFCGDRSNHLGINLQSHIYTCWKCTEKGSLFQLVKEIEGCSFGRAVNITKKYIVSDFDHLIRRERSRSEIAMLPAFATDDFLPIHDKFLEGRRYDRLEMQRRYDIMAVGPTLDDWKFRILIPIIMDGELKTFVGRDTTGKSDVPYKNSPIEKSVMPAKECLYGIDDVKDTAVLVEGLFDRWRYGKNAVCTFGVQMTPTQIYRLRFLKRVVMLFDADALKKADGLGHAISSVVPQVDVIELPDGDPDDLSEDDLFDLKRVIGHE